MNRAFFILGAISAFLSVAAGAFAAHGLKPRLTPEMLEVFKTGAHYQMMHALGLILCALAVNHVSQSLANAAGWCFVAGTVLFSGSLYLLALTGVRWLGAITPIGGVAFLAGWACLAIAALRAKV